MDYSRFSKKELSGMLEIIHSSVTCRGQHEMLGLIGKLKELVSGDYGVCGIGKGGGDGLTDVPKVVNFNYPEEWLKIYGRDQLYFQDPIIWHNFQHPGAQLWDDTYQHYAGKVSPEFVERSKDFGLCHGVSGGLYDGKTGVSTIFTFSGRSGHFTGREKEMVAIVTPHLHQAMLRVFKEERNPCAQLSKREREVIVWMKEGKTNWEISMILNISERTVKFHVQNIERKLNAVNKAHAIAIALEANLAGM